MGSTMQVSFTGRGQNCGDEYERSLSSSGERGEIKVDAKIAASGPTGARKNFSAQRNSNLPLQPQPLLSERKCPSPPWIS